MKFGREQTVHTNQKKKKEAAKTSKVMISKRKDEGAGGKHGQSRGCRHNRGRGRARCRGSGRAYPSEDYYDYDD